MDPFTLAFYASVCGVLSVIAPRLGGFFLRLGIGALVGIIAALALPAVRVAVLG